MEKEASRRSGRSISDKKSSNSDDDVGSTKLHSAVEEFPSKIRVMGRRFDGGGGGGGGGRGHTGSNSGGVNEVVGHMYFDSVSTSRLAAENFSTNSQLFDIFAAPHSTTTTPFKSPVMAEGLMATSIAFPFTSAQWRELERQAMIYKYMISSIPVPPDLLFPLSRNFPPSAVDSSLSSMYSVRYSKNGDPEPGRCKRTDGKKWRCSKDVAPHQKYCERHLHRGRPRSRKPVEDKNVNGENNKRTRIEQTNNLPNSTAAPNEKPLLLFNPKSDLNLSNTPSSTRDLSLMMDTEQKWQRLIETNMGFSNEGCSIYDSAASLFHQDYVDQSPLNMLSYSSYPPSEIVPPFSFIDAWSIENGNVETTGPKEPENFSPSLNLSIAMASGSISDQEMAGVHNCCGDDRDSKCHDAVYWEPFALGGPLAEALPAWGCKNPASPHDSISTVATTVSSPTGVLHRTLFSHSDGSVCNSPTFPAPISEVAFRWLN